ncbi:hypothetical protein QAD02_012996 [Eretmocerus hayati]|uniref:Uncharacterized protein n=1 Tax=Eretmocerus hayati TaxID=131215 RepID=A0ACC2P3U6_9HYME|nr:hypothetical protein QAD02_012996 [Eretmocerus hayati]
MMQETKSLYSRPRNLLLNTPKDTVESLCELQANHFRDQSNFPSESESASKEVSGEPRVLVDPLSTRALFRGRIPSLNEVESQLERMFAGVDGSHNDHGMQHGQKDCELYDGINKDSRSIPIEDLQGMSSTSVSLVTPVRFSEVRYVEQDIKSSENDELERRIENEGIDFDLSGCGERGLPGSRNIIGKCKIPAIRMRSSKCDTSDVRIQYPSRENDDERNKERRKISSSGPILKQTKASRRGIPDYFGELSKRLVEEILFPAIILQYDERFGRHGLIVSLTICRYCTILPNRDATKRSNTTICHYPPENKISGRRGLSERT